MNDIEKNKNINNIRMNDKEKKLYQKSSSKNLIFVDQLIDKNLISENPQLSSKNLIKINPINSISFLDLYPIKELKLQRKKNILKKKNTDIIPQGILSKESMTVSTKISIDNNNSPLKLCKNEHFAIATTGATFEKLYALNEIFISKKNMSLLNIHRIFRLILKNGIIFSRMGPDHKALLIDSFKKEQMSTLMCGDGTNDCPALRKADVGVSLSSEEASMASHFNYTKQDISCLFHLLKEGKCALSASMQTFKFMIMYSVLCYIAAIFLMYNSSNVSDMQGFFLDLFLIYPLEWFVSQTDPTDELTYERPIGSLFSFPIVLSLLGQILIGVIFQYGGYYYLKHKFMWENLCIVGEEGDPEPCPENTIIYIINQFQLIFSAITLYKSKPFRRSILTNKILMLYLATGIIFTIYITIFDNERLKYAFDLFDFEMYEEESKNNDEIIDKNHKRGGKHYYMIKYYLLIISFINMIVTVLFEWVIVGIAKNYWWKKKSQKYKEKIKNEKSEGLTKSSYNIDKEVPIQKYISLYYHERRNKIRNDDKDDNNADMNFIDDNEDDIIELEDMTPNGIVVQK